MSSGWRFCADWSPQEELTLLEAIEEFGYGNWPSIGIKVGKAPEECKAHYDHYYINQCHNVGSVQLPVQEVCPAHVSNEVGVAGGRALNYYPGMEIHGYMPYRGDFAFESDNKAELMIADLDADPEDEDEVVALQQVAVQMYQARLAQRARRKRFVLEYGLLDILRQVSMDQHRLSRRQLWMKNISRPFMRFLSPTNAYKFLQSRYLEAQLAGDIKKLQQYRQNGIKTFNGVALYERLHSEKKRRRGNREALLKRNCSPEEAMLFQVLSQGPLKNKKQVSKETKLLDVTYSAGVEKLTSEEKELCSMCRLQPEAYLQFKLILQAEFRKSGCLSLAEARKLLRIDVNKTRKIYDHLRGQGLILAGTETSNSSTCT